MTTVDTRLRVQPDLVVRERLLCLSSRRIVAVDDEGEVDGPAVHLRAMHCSCLALVEGPCWGAVIRAPSPKIRS
jgi:hypothetical protein